MTRTVTWWFALAWLGLASCASAARQGGPAARSTAPAPLWQSRLDANHPLVGRIWDVAAERFVAADTWLQRAAAARLLVLGEQHDNPDHHTLQARVIEAVVAAGRKPALVFEMLEPDLQPAIDRARAEHPNDVDALRAATAWDDSGWPPWPLYRPVFAVAVRAGLPIIAAGLGPDEAMQLAREGVGALDPELARRFALADPLAPDVHAEMRAEMRDAHCGLMPDAMLDAMVLIQRARDARMADRLHAAGAAAGGAVLIAGNGHARSDRGVPAVLARALGEQALSLALLEVQADRQTPADYAAGWGGPPPPFDALWFTPRVSDEDHCEQLKRSHRR